MVEYQPKWVDEVLEPDGWSVSSGGVVTLGGVDVMEVARRHGTPAYLIDGKTVRARAAAYVRALKAAPPGSGAYFAMKSLAAVPLTRLLLEAGMGIDVVSYGEMLTALRAGAQGSQMILHGNNKSERELRRAVETGITVVIDGNRELERLEAVAGALRRRAQALLRLSPGIEAHTHSYILTGGEENKFGIPIVTGQAEALTLEVLASPWVELKGYHSHIGSQILEVEPFVLNARAVMAFAASVRERTGFWPQVVDLGGGLGIAYTEDDRPPAVAELVAAMLAEVESAARALGQRTPALWLEPGRSIVGGAGVTIYTVGERKRTPGGIEFVAVDGGMGDNPRMALYQAVYRGVLVNRVLEPPAARFTVAGRNCESGDLLTTDLALPEPRAGDILALFSTGAYTYSMASHYNRVPKAPVLWLEDGVVKTVVRRESEEELLAADAPPDALVRDGLEAATG